MHKQGTGKGLFCGGLVSLLVLLSACQPPAPEPYRWAIPDGFPLPLVPEDNPMSADKVALGEKLFFDVALSFNQSQSCATCHQPQFAFAEPRKVSVGASGQVLRRNAQALVNVAYNPNLTWAHNGLTRIEQQILIPMFAEDPIELGITGHESEVLARFQRGAYPGLFQQAFNTREASFDLIVKALASYVRSLVSFNSRFDLYAYKGQDDALNAEEKRGMELFFSEQLECFHCHGGVNFTQSSQHQHQRLDLRPFHNTGLYNEDGKGAYPAEDPGLIEISLQAQDMGKFRAPTLRNVANSAPYMHDGSIETLSQVIDFYAQGGRGAGINSPLKDVFVQGFSISDEDKKALIAFLHSLSDADFLAQQGNRAK